MGPGLTHVDLAIGRSLASSTWADYNAAWKDWCAFLNSKSQNFRSFSEDLFLLFLDFLCLSIILIPIF